MTDRPDNPEKKSAARGGLSRRLRSIGIIWRAGLGPRLKSFVVRTWALVIMLVVLGVGVWAVRYLYFSIFEPLQVPEQFHAEAVALSAGDLQSMRDVMAVASESRVPVGHYHNMDQWFQPDPRNTCLTSGCHTPLPHARSIESRAFANSHTLFLDCMICHDAKIDGPVQATWLSIYDGVRQQPPPALRLATYLEVEADRVMSEPVEAHGRIEPLLRETLFFVDETSSLHDVHLQLTLSEPGSPVWEKAVRQLIRELSLHIRGEYGAKIALNISESERSADDEQMLRQAAAYLRLPKDSPQRDEMLPKIHKDILGKPGACLACHKEPSARLDFAALGYSPEKIESITGSLIVQQIQHIREGTPFYLPSISQQGGRSE